MDSGVYKSLLSDIKAGELKKVLNILSGNQLTNEAALNFVICCCNACMNAKNNFTGEELITTLKICSNYILTLDNNFLDSYLRSTYYILKYFVGQKDPKHIVKLEFLLLPRYAMNLNEKSNNNIYQECSKVIHNFILKVYNSEPKISAEDFLNLCILYFKMCFEVSATDIIQQKLYNFFGYCWAFGVDILNLHKTYLLILNLLEEKKDVIVWNEDLCKSVFILLSIIVKPLVKQKYFCHVKDVIHSTINTVKTNFSNDVTDKATKILGEMTGLITEEECHPSKKRTVQIFSSCSKGVDALINLYGISAVTVGVCMLCHTIIYSIVNNYESFGSEFWEHTMNEAVQIDLFQLTKCISNLYCRIEVKCPCGMCGLSMDITSAYSCSAISGHLFKDYRDKTSKTQLSDKLLDEFERHMEACCKFILKLKQRECAKWKSLWKEMGAILYNTSIDAQKLNVERRITIKKLFLRYLIQLEGTKDSVILKDILKISLSCLVNDYLESKEVNNALVTSALNVCLWPGERKSLFLKWAHIKSEYKNDECLQQLNLASVFVKHELFIRSIHPEFAISKLTKIELLKFELKQYKNVWPSKISITCVLDELYLLADIVSVVEALVYLWDFPSVHKYIQNLLKQVLEKYKREAKTTKHKIYLACLYYIQYNACRENMRSKNNKDMERACSITNEKNFENEHVIPNDECDIVTSYESLVLDKYKEAMKYIHKALEIFENSIDFDAAGILVENKIYDVLVAMAFEYRLQCYTLEYFRACFLCLKVARMIFNKLKIIESIGFIIEIGNMQSNSTRSLLFEVEQLIQSLIGNDAVEKWETLTLFYISKSIAYLFNDDVSKCLGLYKDARNAYDKCGKSKNRKLLEVRLDYLQWLLFLLPCEYEVEGHYYDSLVKPMLTLHTAHDHYISEGHKSSYFMVMLFETYTTLVRKYIALRLPRETRCYCREVTLLAQRLLIPLQSVKFLSVLAEADLMSGRFDDCLVKIHGMCEILGISKHVRNQLTTQETKAKTEVMKPMELLSNRFEEMMLNIPSSFIQHRTDECGSPILETDQFKVPSFINHNSDCVCYHCMSIDFQECVLVVLNLGGLLNAYQSNFSSSQEHYNNAMSIYNHLALNENNFREKIFQLINHDVFPRVDAVLLETYTSILLNVRNNIMGTPKFEDVNRKLLPLLEKIKPVNIHIYNEACLQLNVNKMYHRKVTPVKMMMLSPITDREQENVVSFLTPDSKCSIVPVPVTISPQAIPRKAPVKKIKFQLFNDDTNKDAKQINFDLFDGKDSTTNTKSSVTMGISKVRKTPKTPAPPLPDAAKTRNPTAIKAKQKKLDLHLNCPPPTSSLRDENKQPTSIKHAQVPSHKNAKKNAELLTKIKRVEVGKKPLKQIPAITVITCDDGGEQSEASSDIEKSAQKHTEPRIKQESEQELRRSKRNQGRLENNAVKDAAAASSKGATKKTLRN